MKFSQRLGFTEVRSVIQSDGMSTDLRNSLWNVFDQSVWSVKGFMYDYPGEPDIQPFSRVLWSEFFKLPLDQRPEPVNSILLSIRNYFFSAEWFEVYDFIEFCLWIAKFTKYKDLPSHLNRILEQELSGYRVVASQIIPVTDNSEITAIEHAVTQSPYQGARAHLSQAMHLLSNKQDPDYRNSVKESISAVESACRDITQNEKATLGDALKELKRSGHLHASLQAGFGALYGYTSDEQGIRHAMSKEPSVSQAEAKYFLVSCAAFVNYLAERQAAAT